MDDFKKLRLYWSGKNPKTRAAVMEYIANEGTINQATVAEKHGVNEESITRHVRQLRKLGYDVPPSHKLITCTKCGAVLNGVFPKYSIVKQTKPYKNSGAIDHKTEGYLCIKCFSQISKRKFIIKETQH